jgi:hypothetical protein
MPQRSVTVSMLKSLFVLGIAVSAFAAQQPAARGQAPAGQNAPARGAGGGGPAGARGGGGGGRGAAAGRAPLFFREEWKQSAAGGEHPVSQESVANPNLELKLYGSSAKEIAVTGAATDENNPIHAWTGLCTTPCALTLRDKNNFVDLTGLARIKWVTKMSGFHKIRPVVKLADGTLLVGDREDGSTVDWLQNEFSISDLRWVKLDADRVVTVQGWVANPNLSTVDEVGFVDLLPGSGHGQGGWADVAAIEVYGKAVKR